MQYWTKEKPKTTGYYWVKFCEDITLIAYVSVNDYTYVTIDDEVLDINHHSLRNTHWSDRKIQEPIGVKI
jgi:hypothetical protein